MPHRLAIVLLAAGGSSRMGRPKQLLTYNGRTLLRAAADAAIACAPARVIVVLGNEADRCRAELQGLDVTTVVNNQWSRGMGSSLRAGAKAAATSGPSIAAVLIHLCDQPLIDAAALRSLIDTYNRTDKPVVVSEYGGAVGPPVLFAGRYFDQLQAWPHDDAGAKALINAAPPQDVARVPLPPAAYDLDTPADFDRLRENRSTP